MDRKLASSLVIVAGLLGMADPAAARVVSTPMTGPGMAEQCEPAGIQPIIRFDQPQLTKSFAILGGQTSALERVMQDQGGLAVAASQPRIQVSLQSAGLSSASPATGGGLVPGAAGGGDCSRLTIRKASPQMNARSGLGDDDFLLTRRLPVGRTAFDAEWGRVSGATLSVRAVQRMLPRQFHSGVIDLVALEGVNAWANHRIRYAEDAKLFGRADHWATAESTLRKRAGDCEDIAIAKMQILAAMGVPRSDMFLTIARDLVRRADHALLVVRIGNRHWVLDNAADQLLDANDSLDYQPVLSFSTDRKWLHGAVTLALN